MKRYQAFAKEVVIVEAAVVSAKSNPLEEHDSTQHVCFSGVKKMMGFGLKASHIHRINRIDQALGHPGKFLFRESVEFAEDAPTIF